MRALVVAPHEKTVRLTERSGPCKPHGGEVLLRTLEEGICGTDREICAFEYGAPPQGAADFILGHEALAEVTEVGPDVTWVRPGELIVPMERRPSRNPRCLACSQGRQDFCVTGEFSERGIGGVQTFPGVNA